VFVAITKMPPCGFGNRVIYYYNLRQMAHDLNCEYLCAPWEGYQYFQGELLGTHRPTMGEEYKNLSFCLGEKFFGENKLSTREVFKLKVSPVISDKTCAIHFRGTDFHGWNPDAILDSEYYLRAIEEIKDDVDTYVLFTDDYRLESYNEVEKHLKQNNKKFFLGKNTSDRMNYISDFSIMSECDYIISSPSTFCISAGFVGKEKRIIHSKKWIEKRAEVNDKFWVDLKAGGNKNYSAWRII
tara:strand:+ start:440 stop:1162 length:723 start_codon:yes stop_codon:yes gene_type:complete